MGFLFLIAIVFLAFKFIPPLILKKQQEALEREKRALDEQLRRSQQEEAMREREAEENRQKWLDKANELINREEDKEEQSRKDNFQPK